MADWLVAAAGTLPHPLPLEAVAAALPLPRPFRAGDGRPDLVLHRSATQAEIAVAVAAVAVVAAVAAAGSGTAAALNDRDPASHVVDVAAPPRGKESIAAREAAVQGAAMPGPASLPAMPPHMPAEVVLTAAAVARWTADDQAKTMQGAPPPPTLSLSLSSPPSLPNEQPHVQ